MPTLLLLLAPDALAADQRVTVEVAADWRPGDLRMTAELEWLGEARRIPLSDDGSVPGDQPFDNIWTGVAEGEAVRMLPIRLFVGAEGAAPIPLADHVEIIVSPDQRIAYALVNGGTPALRRVAMSAPPQQVAQREAAQVAAWAGWGGLAFLYVAWLVGRSLPRSRR